MRMNIESATDLKHSVLWEAVSGEIDERIKGQVSRLRACNESDLKIIQLKINMYEEIKNLPQDVIDRETSGE